jgi:DNA-binding transcriptional regulator YiaG
MKTKIVKHYVYEGLGFPVELGNVEMVYLDNDWHPRVDVQKVADDVVKQLAIQETRLTGTQVKFIRSYFSMALREFGEAVKKWEQKGGSPTNMNSNTEHELRLYIVEKLHSRSRESKSKFYDIYMATKRFFDNEENSTSIIHAHA